MFAAATPDNLGAILELLEMTKLPTAGVKDHIQNFILEFSDQTLIACAGLEIHGQVGLLRSVAVNPNRRNNGIGSRLVKSILEYARTQPLLSVFLLTETAENYFPRFGFKPVTRAKIPEILQASKELRGACPDTAVVMMLEW